jgi:uncharacterized protein (DUF362 family)
MGMRGFITRPEETSIMLKRPPVAIWQGADRKQNIESAMALTMGDIDWPTRHHVVVKPNLVSPYSPNGNTHIDALRTVLKIVRAHYVGRLSVAEGCATRCTATAFQHLGFDLVAREFDAQLVDLNSDQSIKIPVLDRHGRELALPVARTVAESDCRISLCIPKTHDYVMVTLGIKNMVMGSMVNCAAFGGREAGSWPYPTFKDTAEVGQGGNGKDAMHQGYPMMNVNLALIARHVLPHMTVLDGSVGMEGSGPVHGEPVPWDIAIAGAGALDVDAFAAGLMGFSVEEVGYLSHCQRIGLGVTDAAGRTLAGNVQPAAVKRAFRRHPGHAAQSRWNDAMALAALDRMAGARIAGK